jgi:hypothetical protein
MAQSKGNIEKADPEEGQAVATTTEETPHPADESSAPGPYDGLEVNRPPVSTNRPDVPIAESLVAGAGAPTPEPDIHPETYVADNAYVSSADKENMGPKPDSPKGKKEAEK